MNIQELEDKHFNTRYSMLNYDTSFEVEHTKLSVEFAIGVLEELNKTFKDSGDSNWWYEMKVENKIEELKTYLDDKN
jgi:hypothetical protein